MRVTVRGAEGDRLVGAEAPPAPSRLSHARGAGGVSKRLATVVAEARAKHPDTPVEVWATDEHRIGLKPIIRRVWAPQGQRPIALGHHRYRWLDVTAFVQPTSGERAADLRRDLLVCVERDLQAVLRRAAGAVCARGRGGTGAHHRARARQRRLAHRTEPGCSGWDPARLPAPILARASAG